MDLFDVSLFEVSLMYLCFKFELFGRLNGPFHFQ